MGLSGASARRPRWHAAAAGVLAALVLTAGCGQGQRPRTHGSFTAGGVNVAVTLERSGAHTVAVSATLRPQRAGFHVYSLTLPDAGVDGLGIPTRLSVGGPLTAEGPVTASARPHGLHMADLDVTLPVYPDGPVTLRLTARLSGKGAAEAPVRLGYGACSATQGCLMPVRDRVLAVDVPG
ncbi:hypothetical protein [Actinacidiphila guanduensis]|uniref:Thiol:disulfide interchange protein DsbD N-terminal domain-containing protein n=1 Tax=Actinacidiphila guanduensis TaxID=310781 RepID=A0A1H0K3Z5_9ACTN|nr:hypothetical protein [Actinacidiphila guanduensis]SDO50391.1 hypothetical protein SAMN05216259_11093 [Actinacidiphila guanduensis]